MEIIRIDVLEFKVIFMRSEWNELRLKSDIEGVSTERMLQTIIDDGLEDISNMKDRKEL